MGLAMSKHVLLFLLTCPCTPEASLGPPNKDRKRTPSYEELTLRQSISVNIAELRRSPVLLLHLPK
jgi:hypothetical protein